jgi:hypothetical protein
MVDAVVRTGNPARVFLSIGLSGLHYAGCNFPDRQKLVEIKLLVQVIG